MAQINEGGGYVPPRPASPPASRPPAWTQAPPKRNKSDRTKDDTSIPGGPGVSPAAPPMSWGQQQADRNKRANAAATAANTPTYPNPWAQAISNAIAAASAAQQAAQYNWAPVPTSTPAVPDWTKQIPSGKAQKQTAQPINYSLLAGNNPWSLPWPAPPPQWAQFNSEVGYGSQVFPLSSNAIGAAPFTFFQNTPLGWNTPSAPLPGKGGAAKGGGYGRRRGGGGGGTWYDGGSRYPASAWASLVGWNINR